MTREAALAVLLVAACPSPAVAQAGAELGLQATALLRDHPYYGGGLSAAWRTAGRARIALAGLYGASEGEPAFRGELTGHFMISPSRRGGVGVYGIGGAGFEGGSRDEGFFILGLGLETNPGGRSGLHVEAGVGGGARLSAGWRTRWIGQGGR